MERTIAPTPRRLAAARRAGDGPLSEAATRVAPVVLLLVLGPLLIRSIAQGFRASLLRALDHPERASALEALRDVVSLTLPFCVAAAVVATTMAALLLGGFVARRGSEGAKPRGAALRAYEALRGASGIGLVVGVAIGALASSAPSLAHALGVPGALPAAASDTTIAVLRVLVPVLVALAIVDVFVKRAAFHARWRMTPREAALERREAEGDPAIRSARRKIHERDAR